MKTYRIPMPSFWASYLINGDASGMEPYEVKACDEHLQQQGILDVLDISDDEYFSWSFDLYGGECAGGNLSDYTVTLVPKRKRKVC